MSLWGCLEHSRMCYEQLAHTASHPGRTASSRDLACRSVEYDVMNRPKSIVRGLGYYTTGTLCVYALDF